MQLKPQRKRRRREIDKHTSVGYGSNRSRERDCMRGMEKGERGYAEKGIRAWMQGDERYEERERENS